MPVTLLAGPMFSGKTTCLLECAITLKQQDEKFVLVKHSIDTRYSNNTEVISHGGIRVDQAVVTKSLLDLDLKSIDWVLIDEGHFFDDLYDFVVKYRDNKSILISGLLTDFKMEPFISIERIVPLVESVRKFQSKCSLCNSLTDWTARVKGAASEQILVGAADLYEPRCRTHHPFCKN
jgi:thymidine kinase